MYSGIRWGFLGFLRPWGISVDNQSTLEKVKEASWFRTSDGQNTAPCFERIYFGVRSGEIPHVNQIVT